MLKKINLNRLRILITGARGLVGSEISKILKNNNIKILTPDKKELNLLNYKKLDNYLKKNKINFVIHAAAKVGGINDNIKNRIDYISNNTLINYNTIMCSYRNKIKFLINIGSSCMYPSNFSGYLKENMIDNGMFEKTNEGHAISKLFSLKLCSYITFDNKKFLYKNLIPCNIYGDNDNFNLQSSHFIPAIIKKISLAKKYTKNKVIIWGDGTSKREILHVNDLAEGVFFCVKNFYKMPLVLNIGSSKDCTIKRYYETVAKIAGYSGKFTYDKNKPNGMKRKILSTKKIRDFGWYPKISIIEGLTNTYLNFSRKKN